MEEPSLGFIFESLSLIVEFMMWCLEWEAYGFPIGGCILCVLLAIITLGVGFGLTALAEKLGISSKNSSDHSVGG